MASELFRLPLKSTDFPMEPPLLSDPPYINLLPFEKSFNFEGWRSWVGLHWTLSTWISLFYIWAIFFGEHWMRTKRPYNLRKPLLLWNLILATFSIFGCIRILPELFNNWGSVCVRDGQNLGSAFWGLLGVFSKVVELGDTAFIILRKQKLVFLHPFHHVTVLIFCWWSYEQYDPALMFFLTMNYGVHGLMYSYYACRAAGFRPPKVVAMIITVIQTLQMIIGIWISVYSASQKAFGWGCDARRWPDIFAALFMYLSYAFLFVDFFRKTYLLEEEEKRRMAKWRSQG